MTTVVLGTNKLENCEQLIAVGEQPLLQVEIDPVVVSLVLPEQASRPLVRRNEVARGDVRIVQSEHDVGIFTTEGHFLICNATRLEPDHVVVHIDLRPFGLAIFTDGEGLHVGKSVLAHNTIQGARTAIALG